MERFFKYQGLGNDFVVLDRRWVGALDVDAAMVKRLCDRHRGIGADGVLTILPDDATAGRMVVHNADGSIAQMCGNGLRCVAKHLAERSPRRVDAIEVATGAGPKWCQLEWSEAGVEQVTVAMGAARLLGPELPRGGPFVEEIVLGQRGTAVSMGNPHFVLLETPAQRADALGPQLETAPIFPEGTNVEFVSLREAGGLAVTVWERGVGRTLACGTGACAAVVAAAFKGRVAFDVWVPVELPGGVLHVLVERGSSEVSLRGPATFVFEGILPEV